MFEYMHARVCKCLCALSYFHVQIEIHKYIYVFVKGSFDVKLPTIWKDGKAEAGRVREEKRKEKRRKKKEEDQRIERVRGNKMQVRFTTFFPLICGSGGSNSRLAKAAGRVRSHLAR